MTSRIRIDSFFACAWLLVASVGLASAVRAAEPFDAFVEKHCIRCRGPEKEKSDLRIDQLSRDFKVGADTHHWAELIEQVKSGARQVETTVGDFRKGSAKASQSAPPLMNLSHIALYTINTDASLEIESVVVLRE